MTLPQQGRDANESLRGDATSAANHQPQPDSSEVSHKVLTGAEKSTTHLNIVLNYLRSGYVELRALKRNADGSMTPNGSHFINTTGDQTAELNTAIEWAKNKHRSGAEIYIGYNPRETQAGSKEAVKNLCAFYTDIDLHGADPSAALEAISMSPVQPHLVVDSGYGLHVIWFTEPFTDKVNWTSTQSAIQKNFERFGADKAVVKDESRMLRLVPFSNLKNGKCKPTSIIQFRPGAMADHQDIRNAFGEEDYDIDQEIRAVTKNELPATFIQSERNNMLTKMAGSLRRLNLDVETMIDVLTRENIKRCHPPLDQKEVIGIARSVGRYDPDSGWLGQSEEVPPLGKTWGELKTVVYGDYETIIHELSRGEICQLVAKTNVGKSTLLRNLAISLACGRPYLNLTDGEPRRVLFLDFETRESRFNWDVTRMIGAACLTNDEQVLVDQNLILICDEIINDMPLCLSDPKHMRAVENSAQRHRADLIIVDTVAAAFDVRDENSNSEVQSKVIKPLTNLARACQAALIFAHHRGKQSEDANADAAYRSRGASAFGAGPTLVLNLNGDKEDKKRIVLSAGKVKGEELPDMVLRRNADRWFTLTDESAPEVITTYRRVVNFVSREMKPQEIYQSLPDVPQPTIKRYLSDAVTRGDLKRVGPGVYAPNIPPDGLVEYEI